MKITIWGCRGSLPAPGPEKHYFGGNTTCVQVVEKDTCIILDGGSGILRLCKHLEPGFKRIDILLTHLHLDHIMGLGFFTPFYDSSRRVHIWGPSSGSKETLEHRLRRYFSPPLFPVRLNELLCRPHITEINQSTINIGDFKISSEYVCHPGPTLGYRIEAGNSVLAFIPDHEPVLAASHYPDLPEWTSGYSIAKDADLLMHDSQYTSDEYERSVGFGHSSMEDALKFGEMAKVKKMLLFHHDPSRTDDELNQMFKQTIHNKKLSFEVELCVEDSTFNLD